MSAFVKAMEHEINRHIESFSSLLMRQMYSLHPRFTAKEKRRIFRRRPRDFRDRWKKIYPKWLEHQDKKYMSKMILNPRHMFDNLNKSDIWEGSIVRFPGDPNASE